MLRALPRLAPRQQRRIAAKCELLRADLYVLVFIIGAPRFASLACNTTLHATKPIVTVTQPIHWPLIANTVALGIQSSPSPECPTHYSHKQRIVPLALTLIIGPLNSMLALKDELDHRLNDRELTENNLEWQSFNDCRAEGRRQLYPRRGCSADIHQGSWQRGRVDGQASRSHNTSGLALTQ